MGRLLALIGALIAAGLLAWWDSRPPGPQPASAPAVGFSAERAIVDIKGFASVPHPVGSDADRQSRDYVVRRMIALGLSPQVKPGAGVYLPRFADNVISGGYVQDVVGVLPGRDRSAPPLALMAHYDSVPGSTGASDDASGVATALEVIRAMKARGTPARDVVLLVTDGEEAGLLGADAFFRSDPLAKRIGFVINMEARGSSGRVQMFQTAAQNDAAIRAMQAAAPRTQASSLSGFIYEQMPNDTDFSVSKRAGTPGLNYAFAGRQFDYHSPSSTPATQDLRTLQDMGDQVLPTAMALAFAPALPVAGERLVYGNMPGGLLLAYAPVMGWLVLIAAALLAAGGVARARRSEAFPWLDLARGAGAALFGLATGAAVMHLARKLTGAAMGYVEQRFLLAQAPRWEAALILLATGVLLLAAAHAARGKRWLIALLPFAAGLAGFALDTGDKVGLIEGAVGAVLALAAYGRPASRPGAWTGVLILALIIGVGAQATAPAATPVFAWPLALAALGSAITAAGSNKSVASLGLLALFAALGMAFAATLGHSAFLSLDLVELLCLPMLMAAIVVWPLAQTEEGAPPARLLGPALIMAGLAVTLAVRFNNPYDARHPEVTDVAYSLDQDARKGWRVSYAPRRNAWTTAVLTADGGKIGQKTSGRRDQKADAAPAPYIETPAPQLSFDRTAAGDVALHVVPPPDGRVVDLKLTSSTAATVTAVGGVPVKTSIKPGGFVIVRWSAAQAGFDVDVHPGGPGKLTAYYSVTIERWPSQAKPLPPRPKDVAPFDLSDSTVVEGSRSFSW
jgi:hypothetical protein